MQQCVPARRTSPDSSSPPRESTHRPEATWVCCCAYQKCTRCASCATLQRASPYQARIAAIEPHGGCVCGLVGEESPAHHSTQYAAAVTSPPLLFPSKLDTWLFTRGIAQTRTCSCFCSTQHPGLLPRGTCPSLRHASLPRLGCVQIRRRHVAQLSLCVADPDNQFQFASYRRYK